MLKLKEVRHMCYMRRAAEKEQSLAKNTVVKSSRTNAISADQKCCAPGVVSPSTLRRRWSADHARFSGFSPGARVPHLHAGLASAVVAAAPPWENARVGCLAWAGCAGKLGALVCARGHSAR